MKRAFLVLLAVALLVAAGLYWRHLQQRGSPAPAAAGPAAKGPARGLPVRVEKVRVGEIAEEVSAVGTLLANESVIIRPEIDGRIAAIKFEEGQLVRAGTELVALDATEIAAQLASAESALTLNRSRLARAEELQRKNFISQQALDDAREGLNQSIARAEEMRARLAKLTVRAPFEGVAGLRQVSPGAYVKAGQDIARLEGIGTLKADFRVPEVYLRKIRTAQTVQITVDAFPGETFRGSIYAIEPAVDEQTRTVLLRARVPNPQVRLKPGMFARVSLVLDVRPQAMLIAEQALVPRGNDRYVFLVNEGKAVLTKVDIGQRRPGIVEVTAGLRPEQTIVVDGQLKLQDGASVTPVGEKPPAAAPDAAKK